MYNILHQKREQFTIQIKRVQREYQFQEKRGHIIKDINNSLSEELSDFLLQFNNYFESLQNAKREDEIIFHLNAIRAIMYQGLTSSNGYIDQFSLQKLIDILFGTLNTSQSDSIIHDILYITQLISSLQYNYVLVRYAPIIVSHLEGARKNQIKEFCLIALGNISIDHKEVVLNHFDSLKLTFDSQNDKQVIYEFLYLFGKLSSSNQTTLSQDSQLLQIFYDNVDCIHSINGLIFIVKRQSMETISIQKLLEKLINSAMKSNKYKKNIIYLISRILQYYNQLKDIAVGKLELLKLIKLAILESKGLEEQSQIIEFIFSVCDSAQLVHKLVSDSLLIIELLNLPIQENVFKKKQLIIFSCFASFDSDQYQIQRNKIQKIFWIQEQSSQ